MVPGVSISASDSAVPYPTITQAMGPLLLLVSALIAATHAQGWLGGGWGIGLSNWVSSDAVMGHVVSKH